MQQDPGGSMCVCVKFEGREVQGTERCLFVSVRERERENAVAVVKVVSVSACQLI